MASLIDYEDMDCKFCGSSGSLVPDGDLNVECTVCGNTYSLDEEDEDEDEDEYEDQDEEENGDDDYYGDYEDEYEDD